MLEWKSHVVYELSCDACNASYIGKAVNTLRERFLGLMLISNLINNLSPLLSFTLEPYNPTHSFDRDKIQVLDSSAYNIDLETKESLYISYLKPSLNNFHKYGHQVPSPFVILDLSARCSSRFVE